MGEVADGIRGVAADVAAAAGLELLEVTSGRRRGGWQIGVTIDKPGGVTVEDCAAMSAALEPRLLGLGLVEGEFRLQVSSPGLDRPLRREEDFVWAVGRAARIVTREPVGGQTVHRGRIRAVEAATVVLECGKGAVVRLPVGDIAAAKLEVELR